MEAGLSHITWAVTVEFHLPVHKPSLTFLCLTSKPSASYSQPRIPLLPTATEPLSPGSLPEKPTSMMAKSRLLEWDMQAPGTYDCSPQHWDCWLTRAHARLFMWELGIQTLEQYVILPTDHHRKAFLILQINVSNLHSLVQET